MSDPNFRAGPRGFLPPGRGSSFPIQGFLDPERRRLLSLEEVRSILRPEGET